MLSCELESACSVFIQSIDQSLRVITLLLDRVGSETGELYFTLEYSTEKTEDKNAYWILCPMGTFDVDQIRQVLIRFCSHELEERREELIQSDRVHGFYSLRQWFSYLDTEFLGARHDPAVACYSSVGKNRRLINLCSSWNRCGVVDELVVVLRPEDFREFDEDLSESTVTE